MYSEIDEELDVMVVLFEFEFGMSVVKFSDGVNDDLMVDDFFSDGVVDVYNL